MTIFIYHVATRNVVPLTDNQMTFWPPQNGSRQLVSKEDSPDLLAKAWCDYWRKRGYNYEPITEDGMTPKLFEDNWRHI